MRGPMSARQPGSIFVADRRRGAGWRDAGCFVVALTALNLVYGAGHALGANPIAFLVYAMVSAALTLLLITGLGPDWRAVIRHPLSWIVGTGIIGMEGSYYMLLRYVPPADGSMLVRLNLPVSVIAAWLIFGRRVNPLALIGIGLVLGAVFGYLAGVSPEARTMAVVLAGLCALISVSRNFAAENHPWNRRAESVWDKMRITGLMLLVTSVTGTALVGGLVAAAAAGILPPVPGVPVPRDFLHGPTIALGGVMGMLVLTAMQFFGFSSVVRIGTENFIAANSFVPLTTLVAQHGAAMLGLMTLAPVEWRFLVAMVLVVVGVLVFISAGRLAGRR